ncbi:MAG: gliding motility-associated ABC transporter substrate-binding protein GldG [Saprospiraceae bacterium]|nr:gliding motility-associated ABC transporter substrate-binding protein GldG [Bacteroidia bacterium]NNL92565.1 gliding motility-associated ABC transporter substrate-binding protein GldG [Saprospiraceae bacterium]
MKMNFQNIIQVLVVLAILLVINLLSGKFNIYADLTEDKIFTLEESTEQLLEDVDEKVLIEVLLSGDLDAQFVMLQNRVLELLKQFKSINSNIDFIISNPSDGTVKEANSVKENLRKDGIIPRTIFIQEKDQRVEKLIYPYAIINLGNRRIPVNLLEGIQRGEDETMAINRSVVLLEYKFASNIQKLISKRVPNIVFTKGNGELIEEQTAMLETMLSKTMATNRINLDSTFQISQNVDVLIVARPTQEISLRNRFIIDQYIMNGGKVIWFIDQFYIDLDSISVNKNYLPRPINHGLDDLFFKYGVRLNKNVVLDLENTKLPQVYGYSGGKPQQQLFSWVYHPLLVPNPENPIVKNIDRVASTFPSTIELLDTRGNLMSTPLLTSSRYSRYQVYPSINISFEIMRIEQKIEAYNKSYLPTAVIVEGEFESFFKNRVSSAMSETLKNIDASFVEKSKPTSQIFVTDSDIIKNLYDAKSNRISPLGFNKWEGYVYEGNQDFIINAIDYLIDDYGLVDSRSKNLKVRLLDNVEIRENKLKWQLINIILPLMIVVLGGLAFNYIRKKKFAA